MDCYSCKHRITASFGSAHSSCQHPNLKGSAGLMSLLLGPQIAQMNVEMNPHGVRNGWCTWPLDFDPVWIESCDGYEAIPEVKSE